MRSDAPGRKPFGKEPRGQAVRSAAATRPTSSAGAPIPPGPLDASGRSRPSVASSAPGGRATAAPATAGPRTSSRRRPSRSAGPGEGDQRVRHTRVVVVLVGVLVDVEVALDLELLCRPGTPSVRRSRSSACRRRAVRSAGCSTSSVNATEHHSWKRRSSRWCWRSRGQCSPRLRCSTRKLSPCRSDRLLRDAVLVRQLEVGNDRADLQTLLIVLLPWPIAGGRRRSAR